MQADGAEALDLPAIAPPDPLWFPALDPARTSTSPSTPASEPGSAPETRLRSQLRRELGAGFRKAVGLTALGTVLPGAGLTQTRSRFLGWVVLGVTLVVAAAGAYAVLTTGVTAAALSVVARPELLKAAVVAIVAWGAIWCVSIVLTAVQARPRTLDRARTRTLAAFTTLMVLLVGGGSYKAAEYAFITQDTVTEVFSAPPPTPGQGAQVAQGEDPWAKQARVNLLLLGSDAGSNRIGTRTDSMIVASIDTRSGRTTLISMPRNLLYAPLAEESPLLDRYPSGHFGQPESTCSQNSPGVTGQCMLTNLYNEAETYAESHPEAYPQGVVPGREEIRGAVEQIVGLDIDHVVVIDLKGFSLLIDAMGGLEINVKNAGTGQPLPIGGKVGPDHQIYGVKEYFKPGLQHLDGWHSLWYARSRAADSDTYRQARQRCVVEAIVEQVNPAEMVGQYPQLARIARDNIFTDIPAQSLPAFVELVERAQRSAVNSVTLTAEDGVESWDPDYAKIRKLVKKGIAKPKPKPTPSATTTPGEDPTSGATTPKPTSTPSPTTTPYSQC
ncbi:LCP family protein [Terrabacter sp. MAHUQ-38]|uniref:LCP family protein n=1 Tax=unclassified Terrabacter TaxID=2630222 RepID=UPI00165E6BC5|nr:LCP family protein [Terrabacter sp. MAHUQ-38]MBC9823817.1 LCP family protein [Terrabacter sp. MAHUQ-38]